MDRLVSLGYPALLGLLVVEVVLIGWGTTAVSRGILRRAPWVPLAYPLILPGTVLHELAHALMAVVLLLGVQDIALFRPRRLANGGIEFGHVRPKRDDAIRGTLVSIAPLILVPPFLLLVTAVITQVPRDYIGVGLICWVVIVGLGSLGAFPSPGDHIRAPGLLAVVVGLALLALFAYAGWGNGGVAVLVSVGVVALSVPAILFAAFLVVPPAARWAVSPRVKPDDEEVQYVYVREQRRGPSLFPRPRRTPPLPRPQRLPRPPRPRWK